MENTIKYIFFNTESKIKGESNMRYEDLNERELILLISQKVTEVADRKAIDEIVRRFDSFTMNHAKIAISYLQKFRGEHIV